jgi:hypothetical protein
MLDRSRDTRKVSIADDLEENETAQPRVESPTKKSTFRAKKKRSRSP